MKGKLISIVISVLLAFPLLGAGAASFGEAVASPAFASMPFVGSADVAQAGEDVGYSRLWPGERQAENYSDATYTTLTGLPHDCNPPGPGAYCDGWRLRLERMGVWRSVITGVSGGGGWSGQDHELNINEPRGHGHGD